MLKIFWSGCVFLLLDRESFRSRNFLPEREDYENSVRYAEKLPGKQGLWFREKQKQRFFNQSDKHPGYHILKKSLVFDYYYRGNCC